jgi:hypothetical protein
MRISSATLRIQYGERFSREQPEPGDYFLIEVLERAGETTA